MFPKYLESTKMWKDSKINEKNKQKAEQHSLKKKQEKTHDVGMMCVMSPLNIY